MGQPGLPRDLLELAKAYERADWSDVTRLAERWAIPLAEVPKHYLKVLSELRARMTRSEAPSRLPCLRRRHFGDQCMPAPDEASSLLGQGDDLAAATASAQVLAELLKRRAEACR